MLKKLLPAIFAVFIATICADAKNVKVDHFKATADGKTNNLEAIQKAIDECSATGGGEVLFSEKGGVYLSGGPIVLKNNVTLRIPRNVTLKAIAAEAVTKGFIYSRDVENIGITGGGTIDGSGGDYIVKDGAPKRCNLVLLENSKNIRVTDITLYNGATWTLNLLRCDTVFIDGIHINAHENFNNDGIDIDAKNVVITNSIIDCDDDAICFKSHVRDYVVENVAVSNCVISSNCSFIKFGTATLGGFKNIAITNCVMKKCTASKLRKWDGFLSKFGVTDPITGIGGISLEAVDGGFADQIVFSNLVMTDVQTPIFIRVGHRNKDEQKSYIKNVIISNVTATSASWITNSITCVDGHILKNITLRDCYFNLKACTDERLAQKSFETEVPEQVAHYPENRMFNTLLPAYGFFLRRVDNITMDNVQMSYFGGNELRPVIFGEKVSGMRLMNCIWQKPSGETEAINLKDSEKPYMFNCKEVKTSFLQ